VEKSLSAREGRNASTSYRERRTSLSKKVNGLGLGVSRLGVHLGTHKECFRSSKKPVVGGGSWHSINSSERES